MKFTVAFVLIVIMLVGVSKACQCTDIRPKSSPEFSCAQQAKFGKCDEDYLQGYCNLSCKRCGDKCECVDKEPLNTTFTCEEFADFGGCGRGWMRDGFYCAVSCEFCDKESGEVFAEEKEEIVPEIPFGAASIDSLVFIPLEEAEEIIRDPIIPNSPTKPKTVTPKKSSTTTNIFKAPKPEA